jgi:hypothetical protein
MVFRGEPDLVSTAAGWLWWTDQNLRLARASPAGVEHAVALVSALHATRARLSEQASVLARCA